MTLPEKPEFISFPKRIHHGSFIALSLSAVEEIAALPISCSSVRTANISLIKNEVSRKKTGAAVSIVGKI